MMGFGNNAEEGLELRHTALFRATLPAHTQLKLSNCASSAIFVRAESMAHRNIGKEVSVPKSAGKMTDFFLARKNPLEVACVPPPLFSKLSPWREGPQPAAQIQLF